MYIYHFNKFLKANSMDSHWIQHIILMALFTRKICYDHHKHQKDNAENGVAVFHFHPDASR